MIKLKDLFNESGILYRAGVKKYGKEGMKKIQQAAGKRKSHAETIVESNIKVLPASKIDSKVWRSMKYDLRDQFDELVKIGQDYGVFQNAQGTNKLLKQIKRLMDKI